MSCCTKRRKERGGGERLVDSKNLVQHILKINGNLCYRPLLVVNQHGQLLHAFHVEVGEEGFGLHPSVNIWSPPLHTTRRIRKMRTCHITAEYLIK